METPKKNNPPGQDQTPAVRAEQYWKSNIKLLLSLLTIWFIASFGTGILFVEPLNSFSIGGYPLGFWFAQQGSIFIFVGLIFFYVHRIAKIERQFATTESEKDIKSS